MEIETSRTPYLKRAFFILGSVLVSATACVSSAAIGITLWREAHMDLGMLGSIPTWLTPWRDDLLCPLLGGWSFFSVVAGSGILALIISTNVIRPRETDCLRKPEKKIIVLWVIVASAVLGFALQYTLPTSSLASMCAWVRETDRYVP